MPSSRRTVAFINIGHALDHLLMLIFPTAVLGMSASFGGRSYDQLLPLMIGGFIAFGAGSIPSGWLGDRWSRRNMMAVFFFGAGLSCLLTAAAQDTTMLFGGLTLIGLFASIYHPVGTAMLVAGSDKLGRAIGINGVWGNMGIAAAALGTGALTQWFGWRVAFIAPGLAGLALGIAFVMMVPDTDQRTVRRAVRNATLRRSLLIRAFVVLLAVTVTGGIVFNAATIAVPKLLAERIGALENAPILIGMLAAVIYAFGAMSQLIIGRLLDRHSLKSVFLPLAAAQAPCLLLAAYTREWALLPIAAAMMFSLFGQVTINDAMVARYSNETWRARIYAVRYFVSFAASAAAIPLVRVLHERPEGFAAVLAALAGLALITLAAAAAFPHRPEELHERAIAAPAE
jgi:MFS family permease